MKVAWQSVVDLLADPVDRSPLRLGHDDELISETGHRYRVLHEQPILLTPEPLKAGGWLFPPIAVGDVARPKPAKGLGLGRRFQRLLRRAVGGQGAGDRFLAELQAAGTVRPRVLIVGGASVGDGCEELVASSDIDVIAFDVYPTAATTFVADGHRIPVGDGAIDGVWIQAVLEHVYLPELVVSEIARVLCPGGLVYAETPFLQPVHEGAYDFMRFTVSGHRLLFGAFEEIESAALGGPGAMLTLAIRGLVGGLTRSRTLARLAYAATLPLSLVDRVVDPRWRADYATGAYFLGRFAPAPREFDPISTHTSVVG